MRAPDGPRADQGLSMDTVMKCLAGTALTDSVLQQRLARVRGGYAFLAAGKLNLAGFTEPVEAFQLLRP